MLNKELELAIKAARTAGDFLRENYNPEVDSQIGKDIKLSYDKKSEQIIIDILSETGIPILSEEKGMIGERTQGKMWIIDPLDGTANYWKGIKELACVSIALWENGKPILGVINRFSQNEIYSGVVGDGAWLNGVKIHTSYTENIKDAFIATGFPVKRDYDAESLNRFIKQVQSFKKVRMLGAAAIMGAFVAAGKIDVYIEEQIMMWDIAASSAIVKAAGGIIDVTPTEEDKCICKLFANETLYEEYQTLEG